MKGIYCPRDTGLVQVDKKEASYQFYIMLSQDLRDVFPVGKITQHKHQRVSEPVRPHR
jgi:hypothetical protein